MRAKRCLDCYKAVRTGSDLCAECRRHPVDRELTGGQWERRGLVSVFVPTPKRLGRPPLPTVHEWDDPALCEAHRMFALGHRDDRTREGERIYYRLRKRAQRAAKKQQSEHRRAA